MAEVETANEAQTQALGASLAPFASALRLIYIRGPLGSGKTVFVRGLLRGLGYAGAVTSPTFTLVEPYHVDGLALFHFDLYRLEDPAELEFLGLRDYLGGDGLCIVEWPERAGAVLPPPDLDVIIRPTSDEGRVLQLQAHSEIGKAALRAVG